MKSIQSKILIVVIAALIVITALVTSIAVNITHEIMHKDADRILNNVSQKEAAYINDMLNDIVRSSAIMEHYAVAELKGIQELSDSQYVAEYISKMRHMFDEVALHTAGISSYYMCFSPEVVEKTSGFYLKFDENGVATELPYEQFSSLELITVDMIAQYEAQIGKGSDMWVTPHASRFTKETVISYIMPIYGGDTFVGILGFNMDFEYLLETVNAISVYEYGYALLLGENGQVCYNPSKETELDGEYAEANVSLINGMTLELRGAYKDIQSGIRPMLRTIIVAFLVVFAAAIVYTLYVTRRIVTPLKKLTEAAASISSGVQDVNLAVDSEDEIGILSRVLDDTYGKIREYSTYINALAYRDSLTGIKNSTAYAEAIEELDREINLANPVFGVIVADINNLKKTNDTYGHDIGNELIVRASKILSDTFKTSAVFRIGGDEFVVLLRGGDLERHRGLVEKMDLAFSRDFVSANGEEVPVSVARGIAMFDPEIDRVYTDVFAKADHAMYMNKELMKASLV